MSDQQLLAVLTAVLLVGKSVTSDEQIAQSIAFAKVIMEKTQ